MDPVVGWRARLIKSKMMQSTKHIPDDSLRREVVLQNVSTLNARQKQITSGLGYSNGLRDRSLLRSVGRLMPSRFEACVML
jgi:hypothetical protein